MIDAYPGVATGNVASVKMLPVVNSNFQLRRRHDGAIGNWQHWNWQHFHIGNIKQRPLHHRRSEGNLLDGRVAQGRRPPTFAAAKMGAEAIPGLLASIRRATAESIMYPSLQEDKPQDSVILMRLEL